MGNISTFPVMAKLKLYVRSVLGRRISSFNLRVINRTCDHRTLYIESCALEDELCNSANDREQQNKKQGDSKRDNDDLRDDKLSLFVEGHMGDRRSWGCCRWLISSVIPTAGCIVGSWTACGVFYTRCRSNTSWCSCMLCCKGQ